MMQGRLQEIPGSRIPEAFDNFHDAHSELPSQRQSSVGEDFHTPRSGTLDTQKSGLSNKIRMFNQLLGGKPDGQKPKSDNWASAADIHARPGYFQPLRNSQVSQVPEVSLPQLRAESPRQSYAAEDDWQVPARHGTLPHRRFPSNAARSMRDHMSPATSPWITGARKPPTGFAENDAADTENAAPKGSQAAELRRSAGSKETPAGSVRVQTAGTLSTTAPPTTQIIKMSRREGWAKFIAYEGSWQICLKASGNQGNAANFFLADGCSVLKSAFGFDALLLSPLAVGGPPHGPTLIWDDAEAAPAPSAAYTEGGYAPVTVTRRMLYAKVLKMTLSSVQAMSGRLSLDEQLCVRLRPATWQGVDAVYSPIDQLGNTVNGAELEITIAETTDDLLVEVVNSRQEVLASARVTIAKMLEISASSSSYQTLTVHQKKRSFLKFLPCVTNDKMIYESMHQRGWIEILDGSGNNFASVLVTANTEELEETVMAATDDIEQDVGYDNLNETQGISSKGYQQITSWQVYDISLAAALRMQKCGPAKLLVDGEWKWLLEAFARTYGICKSYATLAHLRWVMKPENATVQAQCLELLVKEVGPMKKMEAEGALLPQEIAILSQVAMDCERLLARCFENYHSLSESSGTGILEGGQATTVIPAPALRPAVQLCDLIREELPPLDQVWLAERFCAAAIRRYNRLTGAADDQFPFNSDRSDEQSVHRRGSSTAPSGHKMLAGLDADAEVAYLRIGALCDAIKAELNNDLKIHDAGILPHFINLPQVTAGEYCREFLDRLQSVLRQFPPPHPKKPAVDLLVAVGDQQMYLQNHSLLPPAGSEGDIDALKVFGPYVTEWINSSQAALCQRCRQLEGATHATPADMKDVGKSHSAPIVDEMIDRLGREVQRYERVINYWPVFGPQLEGAACAALRDTTLAVSRQCGLSQMSRQDTRIVGANYFRGASYDNGSPARWQWNQIESGPYEARLSVSPNEAVLMNSLRRLLAEVPQLEGTLNAWAGGLQQSVEHGRQPSQSQGPPSPTQGGRELAGLGIEYTPDGRMGPQLGAQFAQLVKELRSEYAAAITGCAQRIASVAFSMGPRILTRLQQHGLTGNPAQTAQEIEPILDVMDEAMSRLARALEGRVYVSVCRGLWDFTAKEVYDYVEGLQEGRENQGAWRGRQNAATALGHVDNFFSSVLTSSLQHELQSKDLDLPLHSDKAHRLLADNTEAINTSYTVY